MEKKKTFIRAVRLLFCAATLLAGPLLYFYLVKKGVGDAMMYSAGSPVFVIALSFLGALGVYLVLNKPLFEDYREEALPEEYEEETPPENAVFERESDETARELYPELFRDFGEAENTEEESPKIYPAYYDALTNAINSQKAEFVPEIEGEEKEEIEDILEIKETESTLPDIFATLPETLPEGYTPYLEEEEVEEEDVEEDVGEKPKASLPLRIARRAIAVIFIIALSVAFGVVSASGYTVYRGDGISVHTFFSEKSYSWQDCEKYEVAPSFFGDRIDLTLYMKDGKKIELLPSDAVFGAAFYEKYDSMYEYALHAGNEMTGQGAEKSVKERNTIENEFFGREDVGEYIKKLID